MGRTLRWFGLVLMAATLGCQASERLFGYVYETETLPKGGIEYEQWLTYRNAKSQGNYTRWDLRHELEYGLTDVLQTSFYINHTLVDQEGVEDLNEDGTVNVLDQESEWEFKGISSEWIYNVLSAYSDPIGLALYFEGTVSETEGELEQKLLLQKNFFDDKLVVAINAVVEEEFDLETGNSDVEGKCEVSGGIAYKITPKFSLGIEAKNQRVYPDNFDFEEHSVWFVGPNVHYGDSRWFATVTVLPQVSGHPDQGNGQNFDDNERIEVRLIAGVTF